MANRKKKQTVDEPKWIWQKGVLDDCTTRGLMRRLQLLKKWPEPTRRSVKAILRVLESRMGTKRQPRKPLPSLDEFVGYGQKKEKSHS